MFVCQCVMGLFGITGNPKHSCNLLCDNGLASTGICAGSGGQGYLEHGTAGGADPEKGFAGLMSPFPFGLGVFPSQVHAPGPSMHRFPKSPASPSATSPFPGAPCPPYPIAPGTPAAPPVPADNDSSLVVEVINLNISHLRIFLPELFLVETLVMHCVSIT